jgi:hypothetical protein
VVSLFIVGWSRLNELKAIAQQVRKRVKHRLTGRLNARQ